MLISTQCTSWNRISNFVGEGYINMVILPCDNGCKNIFSVKFRDSDVLINKMSLKKVTSLGIESSLVKHAKFIWISQSSLSSLLMVKASSNLFTTAVVLLGQYFIMKNMANLPWFVFALTFAPNSISTFTRSVYLFMAAQCKAVQFALSDRLGSALCCNRYLKHFVSSTSRNDKQSWSNQKYYRG